jgi:quinol-cytochrome oxidoreductase complex cytochrome b subunit
VNRTVSSSTSHATFRYTTLRLGIFLGCVALVAVLAYVGILPEGIGKSNPLWILLLGLVLSAPLSYVLLRKQRDAMSAQIADGVDRAKQKLSANRSMEDDAA